MLKSLLTIFIAFWCISEAVADTDPNKKIDPSLFSRLASKPTVDYIVLMKDRTVFNRKLPFVSKTQKAEYVYNALLQKARVTQQNIISYLKMNHIQFQSFYVTNAIKVTSGEEIMKALAAMPEVERIIDNAPFRMLDYNVERTQPSARSAQPEWGIQMIKADSVWALGYKGQGVVIAGQDTGYDWEVNPLKSKYKGYTDSVSIDHNYNWHDAIHKNSPQFPDSLLNPCGYNLSKPCDDNNHGTHTMGTMVGEDNENSIGVAPAARWIACRNMDRGWGQPSTYMECFEWFLAPYDLNGENADPAKAPHVINNSWYCSEEEGCNASNFVLMEDIVKNLKASGVVVVVSAGNSGSQGCGSVSGPPAFFESSFSVGATNSEDKIAGFSSRGPVVIDSSFRLKPNVSAPGVGVRSVIKGGSFAAFSGTSMAGPHVVGLVGLLISANPELAGNVDVIEDIIEATAVPYTSDQDCGDFRGTDIPNAVFGYGRVNALAAVQRALAFTSNTDNAGSEKLIVFPNPADDLITFSMANGSDLLRSVQIFNTRGQLLVREELNASQLLYTMDISALTPGLYWYEVKVGNTPYIGKFVKK